MTEQDILQLRDLAEAGQVQFKERIVSNDDKYDIGCEMVAFSNSHEGRLIIGINDKEITHSSNEFVITILRKTKRLSDQTAGKTDPAHHKTDPVNDPVAGKSDQVGDQTTQNTTNLAQIHDQATQNTTKLTQESDQVSNLGTQNTANLKLSKKQQDIRNYCSVPRTGKEILQRAGVADHFDSRKRYIYDLVEAGVLERTIPDKPNDPNQKYRRKQ